jgi:hypothetical protein
MASGTEIELTLTLPLDLVEKVQARALETGRTFDEQLAHDLSVGLAILPQRRDS